MQLTLDNNIGKFLIVSCEPGKIQVNQEFITNNFIIAPDQLIVPWEINNVAELTLKHLQAILNLQPEIVLIGSGNQQAFLNPRLIALLHSHKIGVEVMLTAAACRTFNVLAAEGRKVVAGLIL